MIWLRKSTANVKDFLPLPPLAEQRRIVAEVERRLSIADGVEKTVAQSLAQAAKAAPEHIEEGVRGQACGAGCE